MNKRGISRFSREDFLFPSTEKLRREPFCVSKTFWFRKNIKDRKGGDYHDFPSNLVWLTVPKRFVGEPFLVSKKFWYPKKSRLGGGGGWVAGITTLGWKFFV